MRERQGILDEPYIGTVSLKLPQSDEADEVILFLEWDVFGVNFLCWIIR
jgi:hypothetical protein